MLSRLSELDYCLAHTSPQAEILAALERETNLRTLSPQMLSGALQGSMLRFVSQMLRPSRILEIGTFTGYSTICLASGLTDGGILHTVEVNDELEWIISKYIQLAGLSNKM